MNPPNLPSTPDNTTNVNASPVSIPPQDSIAVSPRITETPSQTNSPNLNQAFVTPPSTSSSKKRIFKILASFIVLVLIFGGTLGFGVLVAYGKVDLKNDDLENSISRIVFKLPFFEPTPQFILAAANRAHESVTSFYFDSSFAVELEGNDLSSSPLSLFETPGAPAPFDFSSFEFAMNGSFDYSDDEHPKSQFNINIENELDMDFITLQDYFYFKANDIPTAFTTAMAAYGVDPQPFLNSWISYPIEELDTESKSIIDQKKDTEVDSSQIDKFIEVMQTDVLPKITVESTDDVENTYKLTTKLTDQELKGIMRKLSDEKGLEAFIESQNNETNFEQFEVTMWFDKNDFLIRKMQAYTVLAEGSLIDPAKSNVLGSTFGLTQSSNSDLKMHVALTMYFSRYGEHFDIKAPETAESIEEFVARISETISRGSVMGTESLLLPNPGQQLNRARDAARKQTVTQLGHATLAFYTTKQTLPSNTNFWVQELVSAGELSSIPEGVEYTTLEACTKSVVKGSWCYETDTNKANFITYARLENDSDCQIGDSTEPQIAWYVYSSTDARAGTVCQPVEPSVGSQTFAPATLY